MQYNVLLGCSANVAHANTVSSLVAPTLTMAQLQWRMLYTRLPFAQKGNGEGCPLTMFGLVPIVIVGLGVVVVGLLVPYKLCNVAGPSPSVTSAPDRVFR